ncbi:MAG TPA: DUF3048 domain-containing protein, partial [Deinococcales bacterium]|nr:DUF3048 domain-containing protein [Deinococcales bacterium]
QSGLSSADFIAELPVEGGTTRLMALYFNRDAGEVGPIRSARPYFLELARHFQGVLVHDGGSPDALQQIEAQDISTINAQSPGSVTFSRLAGRSAPYNLYTEGGQLRSALNSLGLNSTRQVSTRIPEAADHAPSAGDAAVNFGGARSSFVYSSRRDQYQWLRGSTPATDAANGQDVMVDAVLLARITAQQLPNDTEGRLYIPLDSGGEATLLLGGRTIEGTWRADGSEQASGVVFIDSEGTQVNLAGLKVWAAFVPAAGSVNVGR